MRFTAMKGSFAYRAPLGALLLLLASPPAAAQVVEYLWTGTTGSFSDPLNWNQGFIPNADFDEVGVINNAGTAFVDSMPTATNPGPGAVILGDDGGDVGTLEIRSGGELN